MPLQRDSFQIPLVICATGALMTCAQVLIIRRALALTGGDEVVFALTLAIWLLSVALGSTVGGYFLKWVKNPTLFMVSCLFVLSFSVLVSTAIIIFAASLTGWIPGMVPGGGGIVTPLIIAILPVGLTGGALFPCFCRLMRSSGKSRVATVYGLEACGAFFAGVTTTFIFFTNISTLSVALFFVLTSFGFIFVRRSYALFFVLIFAIIIPALLNSSFQRLDIYLFSRLHSGIPIKDIYETPYGLVEVTDLQGQISIYENGLLLAVSDDLPATEERVHLALAMHPAPQKVLWVGGFPGNGKYEALLHPSLERLDIIELNSLLFQLDDLFITPYENSYTERDQIHIITGDGRRYMNHCEPQTYDLVVLNLPGPRTARLAKYYTVEGFDTIQRVLRPGGEVVFPIESSQEYIGDDLAGLLSTLLATSKSVFDSVTVLPGDRAIFIAGDHEIDPVISAESICQRLDDRHLDLVYWDRHRLGDRLSTSRFKSINEALGKEGGGRLNRDAAPISFYTQQVLWSQQVRGGLGNLLKVVNPNVRRLVASSLSLLLLIVLGIRFSRLKKSKAGALWAVGTVGLTGLALEILALIIYQVHFGSGYREIGLLTGFYMVGLAVGAFLADRIDQKRGKVFVVIQGLWVVAASAIFLMVHPETSQLLINPIVGYLTFFGYIFSLGLLGGLHFPLALSFARSEGAEIAGFFYGIDMGGAALGAMVAGLFALPLIGVGPSGLILAVFNLLPLILLVKNGSGERFQQ